MATESVLQDLEETAVDQLEALNLIYARLATEPATSTLQSAGNASLASLDAKTPALVAGTVPVSLPASQVAALTPPAAISGYATETTLAALNAKSPALTGGSVPVTLPAGQVTALTPPAAITGYATEATTAAQLALDTAGVRGIRRDADTSPVADGQSHILSTQATGRLKVSDAPAAYAVVTGSINSASTTIVADVSHASNVVIEVASGTFAGVNFIFESSIDGTTWKAEVAARTNGTGVAESTSGVIAAAPAYRWEISVNGTNSFRVRATAWTSGAAVINIGIGAYATEPLVSVAPHGVTLLACSATAGTVNTFAQAPVAGAGVLLSYFNAAHIALAAVKATSGRLFGYRIFNPNATVAFVQVFNAATTGSVTLGTTVPIEVYPIPPGATLDGQVDFSYNYSAGIVIAATTTANGSTAVGTGLVVNLRYV